MISLDMRLLRDVIACRQNGHSMEERARIQLYFTGFPALREGRNLDMNLEEYLVSEHITPFLFLLLKNYFFFIFDRTLFLKSQTLPWQKSSMRKVQKDLLNPGMSCRSSPGTPSFEKSVSEVWQSRKLSSFYFTLKFTSLLLNHRPMTV